MVVGQNKEIFAISSHLSGEWSYTGFLLVTGNFILLLKNCFQTMFLLEHMKYLLSPP